MQRRQIVRMNDMAYQGATQPITPSVLPTKPPLHAAHQLQRAIGNQAMQRILHRSDMLVPWQEREGIEPIMEDRVYNHKTLAALAGFTSVYHAIPHIVDEEPHLERLKIIATCWSHAEPAIQELSLYKLCHYYKQRLGKDHRRAFDHYVVARLKAAKTAPQDSSLRQTQTFYETLVAFSPAASRFQRAEVETPGSLVRERSSAVRASAFRYQPF